MESLNDIGSDKSMIKLEMIFISLTCRTIPQFAFRIYEFLLFKILHIYG